MWIMRFLKSTSPSALSMRHLQAFRSGLVVSGFAIFLTSLSSTHAGPPSPVSLKQKSKSSTPRIGVKIQPIANTISGTFNPFELAVGGRPIFKQSKSVNAVRLDGKEFIESKDAGSFFLKLQSDRISLEIRPEEKGPFKELFTLEFPRILSASAQVIEDEKVRIQLDTQATQGAQADGSPFESAPQEKAQQFLLIKPNLTSLEDGLLVELSGARQVTRSYQLDFIVHQTEEPISVPHHQTNPQSDVAQASDGRSFLEMLHDIGSPGIYGAIHLVPTVEDRLAIFGFRMVGAKRWNADLHFVYTGPTAHTSFGLGGSGFYRVIEFRSKKKTSMSLDLGWFFRAVNQTLNNSVQTSHWQWVFNSGPTLQIDPIRLGPVWIGFQVEAPLIRVNSPVGIFSVPVNLGAQISIMI